VDLVIEPFGDAAWRVRLPEQGNRRALLESLRGLPQVRDAIVCERHAVVTFEPDAPPQEDRVREAVANALAATNRDLAQQLHVIAVRYDGADLDDLSREVGLSRDEVISLHAAPVYEVAAMGFLPGFAYLRGLDARLVVPRRASPRQRVPALSVAIAGPYAGVYPFSSPGGWHLLGTAVGFAAFDALRGAALALGDRVRFAPESP
jgi:KipI family sensor histidine kinase inhibitor